MNKTHTTIPQILKKNGKNVIFDGHMWLEITHERLGLTYIIDYNADQYEGHSAYGHRHLGGEWTGKLDYKPFPEDIEDLISKNRLESARKNMENGEMVLGYDKYKKMIYETPGFCNIRVAYELECFQLYSVSGTFIIPLSGHIENVGVKFKVRSGSLGFIQNNGDIFYEFG